MNAEPETNHLPTLRQIRELGRDGSHVASIEQAASRVSRLSIEAQTAMHDALGLKGRSRTVREIARAAVRFADNAADNAA